MRSSFTHLAVRTGTTNRARKLHVVVGGADEDSWFDLGARQRVAMHHLGDGLLRLLRRRDTDRLLGHDALGAAPIFPVRHRKGDLLPDELERGAVVEDRFSERGLVRDRDDPARVLAAVHPGVVADAGTDLHHLGPQRCDVDHVAPDATELDPVADSEDRPRHDVEPAGERSDELLHRECEPGSDESEDQPELPGERSPEDAEPDQRDDGDHVVGDLAGVVLPILIVATGCRPATSGRADDDGDQHHHQARDQFAASGIKVDDQVPHRSAPSVMAQLDTPYQRVNSHVGSSAREGGPDRASRCDHDGRPRAMRTTTAISRGTRGAWRRCVPGPASSTSVRGRPARRWRHPNAPPPGGPCRDRRCRGRRGR